MRGILGLIALLLACSAASAHEGKGPHGGPVADVGKYYVEVMIENGQVQVYLFDDATNAPVTVKGGKGTAVLLIGDQKETVALAPSGADNEMTGKVAAAAAPGARAVVMLELADQPSMVARVAM